MRATPGVADVSAAFRPSSVSAIIKATLKDQVDMDRRPKAGNDDIMTISEFADVQKRLREPYLPFRTGGFCIGAGQQQAAPRTPGRRLRFH